MEPSHTVHASHLKGGASVPRKRRGFDQTEPNQKERGSMSKQGWNPRFTLYARSNGLSERQQLKKDREEWPGGCMIGFSLWIGRKWSDWWKQHRGDRRDLPESVFDAIRGDEEHKLFDEWLCENYRPKE
jgi:hypothetical protein